MSDLLALHNTRYVDKPERQVKKPAFGGTRTIAFWIRIICYDLATEAVVWEKETDLNEMDNRDWLFRTMVWAMTNKKSIEVFNLLDDEKFDMSSLTS